MPRCALRAPRFPQEPVDRGGFSRIPTRALCAYLPAPPRISTRAPAHIYPRREGREPRWAGPGGSPM
jgi:hypothetical protein